MKSLSSRILFSLVIFLRLTFSENAFAGLWEQVEKAIHASKTRPNFTEILKTIPLLTSDFELDSPEYPKEISVANGRIVITTEYVISYSDTARQRAEIKIPLELPKIEGIKKQGSKRVNLDGVRIALDITPQFHEPNISVGKLSYLDFVTGIQTQLETNLRQNGAKIDLIRPKMRLEAATTDQINEAPHDIVISLSFNNDKQTCMTTFCAGNILGKELSNERNRARFIAALFHAKQVHSVELGECIARTCQNALKVELLPWTAERFEGNSGPVRPEMLPAPLKLNQKEGTYLGISTRNTWLNHVFGPVVVNPFPDMQWVKNQVALQGEDSFIQSYSQALGQAVFEFVQSKPDLF